MQVNCGSGDGGFCERWGMHCSVRVQSKRGRKGERRNIKRKRNFTIITRGEDIANATATLPTEGCCGIGAARPPPPPPLTPIE